MMSLKSLIFGSAAGLIAIGGAQAADLPVKAKAVEYVRVCSLYGAGFYYIPGTDTCLKIGGVMRLDTSINSSIYDNPFLQGTGGTQTRGRDWTSSRTRFGFNMDSRTATEYGVVRTYANMQMQWTDSVDGIAGGNFETDYAFIQFAGFTIGKAVSQFDTQWVLAQPAISSGLIGGSDNKTGIPQLAYTATFGNGFSGTIGVEDPRPYRRAGIFDVNDSLGVPGATIYTNSEAGVHMPDFVGNLRLDQAWGSLHLGAAVHEVTTTYNGLGAVLTGPETTGHYDSKYGYAITFGFEIKNLPTGVGDTLRGDVTYANGATRYVFGGTGNINNSGYAAFGGSGSAYQSVAFGQYADAVFSSPGGAFLPAGPQLSTDWGARLFYEHYWTPAWRTSLFGTYAHHENTGLGNSLMMAKYQATFGPGIGGDSSFTVWQVGSRTAWQPVKDLTFSAEVMYSALNTNLSGTANIPANLFTNKPAAIYQLKDQGTVSGIVQALRSF